MIPHVILFRLREDVSTAQRQSLIDAFATALREIPSIRRARVGRRIRTGRSYEEAEQPDFLFAAVLEFDDVAGVHEYLDHSAHREIAARFFAAVDGTLIYDFEMESTADGFRDV